MAQVIQEYLQRWDQFVDKHKDPRVDDWLLMDSVWPGTFLVLVYLFIVWVGPKLMEKRQPFQLREVLMAYNFAMVLLSLYMVIDFGRGGWLNGYTYGCQLVDYSNSPQAMTMLNVCWWFYFSKFIEMWDTFFFILRKKKAQISFLHVFHHAIMPFTWWIGVRFVGGGFGTFHAFLNSFIHFLMYIYYGLAAIGPHMHKYLWWKKYMTKMQLIQFTLVMLHCSQLLFIECPYPKVFVWIIASYGFIFFVLFLHFYIAAYLKKGKPTMLYGNGDSKVEHNGDGRHGSKTDSNSNGYHKLD
ncbi:elongation of very long chain fatty acids protein 7-like isoform X2 [Lytechinus variegatus]|uniref:elongation of very long chain fatty acids protein 7-like isoform X2 n=1 Tax=Lytechinus variegatus TaxID=7654 RepID=UPI001BB27DCC|nr:elongation of very long chain fatty acids protein 7-like isoform X2 [Lytechinus variegatus]